MSDALGTVIALLGASASVPVLVLGAILAGPGPPRHRLGRRRRGPDPAEARPVTDTTVAAVADRVAAAVEAGLPLPAAWAHATGAPGPLRMDSADPVDRRAAAGLAAA
ncbi:MAG: hypothetical protein ACFCVG_12065, partial [Kineosporiaceae bacterium]